jgi:hypothetical protein
MSTVNRSSLKRLLSFGRLGSREVQHDQASISRGGGCSVTLEDLKGIATDQTGVKRLEPIKLVASVLFHPTGACDVFLELEIANPQKLPLELGEIAFSVLPRPDRCQCRSELFSEEPANKEPNWSSMFRNYRPDDIRRDHRFTYTLTTYPHAKNRTSKLKNLADCSVHVTPACFRVNVEPAIEGVYVILHDFQTLSEESPIALPGHNDDETPIVEAVSVYLLLSYLKSPTRIDEASFIYDFDFNTRPPLKFGYFRLFGVLPVGGVLLGSQSSTPLNTHSPVRAKYMFREWKRITACHSTRTHRVVQLASAVYDQEEVYIEALVSMPGKKFLKIVSSFILGLICAVAINLTTNSLGNLGLWFLAIVAAILIVASLGLVYIWRC